MSSYIFKLLFFPPAFSYISKYMSGFSVWVPQALLSGRTELVPLLSRGQPVLFMFYLGTVSSVVSFVGKLIFSPLSRCFMEISHTLWSLTLPCLRVHHVFHLLL